MIVSREMTNKIWSLLLLLGVAIYVLFSDGRIDIWVSQACYNSSLHKFYLAGNEFVDVVLYRDSKWLMGGVALGLVCWGFRQISLKQPGFGVKHQAVGIIGTLLIIGLIDELKKISGIECPWSMQQFGGPLPFIPLQEVMWQALDGRFGEGRCFPAGHPTGGFFLLAWSAASHELSAAVSKYLAIAGLILGFLMGCLRILQGAHFLSHVLWSMWISATLAYALWWAAIRGRV